MSPVSERRENIEYKIMQNKHIEMNKTQKIKAENL